MKNGFQKLAVFSSSICCHCSKRVLFIYTCSNSQLKSFVYECHTCITIIHCETVMGKMVFKANLHIHKSKISFLKTKLSLIFFLLRMKKKKKKVRTCRRNSSKKSWKCIFCSETVSHVDDNEMVTIHISALENGLKTESYIQSNCITETLFHRSFIFIKWPFYIWIILICTCKECSSIEVKKCMNLCFSTLK